jgi:hypothetical protein
MMCVALFPVMPTPLVLIVNPLIVMYLRLDTATPEVIVTVSPACA